MKRMDSVFRRINPASVKLMSICCIGIAVNLVAYGLTRFFKLPFYFDTLGTVFIAALGGYVPGVAVGFLTNLLGAMFNMTEVYFGLVSILVALITAFLAQRGYYELFPKVVLSVPFTIFVTGFFGALIEEALGMNGTLNSLEHFGKHFLWNFYHELPDKGLIVTIVFLVLKRIPPDIKKIFENLGRMQAPISDEMIQGIKKRRKFVTSLRTKMIFNLMATTFLVAIFISLISYTTYRESTIEERKRIADGIVSMVVAEIDPNRVDEFISLGYSAEGYAEVENRLYRIRNSNSDIKYLYVYKIMEDGCHVVFDLDTYDVEASEPGSIEDFEDDFKKYLPALLAGKPIPPIVNDDKYGHLLTIYKPVYNHNGKCVCYAAIDFSMDVISSYGKMFIAKVISLFSGALIFLFILGLAFIENSIILPVNTMAYCAQNFAYDSDEAREQNVNQMRSLDIKTHDEIENLYSAFLKTTQDSMNYFTNFRKAKVQMEVMNELAHTDALTGIKNKTAYNEMTSKIDKEISEGNADFCIIMLDVNYLKRVNDTYGHERGNEYLINACKLATSIFGEENVYRIGGDEFVAVLKDEQIVGAEEKISGLRNKINALQANKSLEPWKKVSAAVGASFYNAGVDKTAGEVFKRADKEMYENKLAMKAVRKD